MSPVATMMFFATLVASIATITLIRAAQIDHDKVQPFAQPEPVTVSDKAAVKFQPQLRIINGCHPYPAVNAAGDTSGGLKGTGFQSGGCKGSELGSQVYSRSTLYRDVWAIMYAWYFPKDMDSSGYRDGVRHDWVNAIVWLDDPEATKPAIRAVSTSTFGVNYRIYSIFLENSISVKLDYGGDGFHGGFHRLEMYSMESGEFQDLIRWEQLTDAARTGLETGDFGTYTPVPFNDANFQASLDRGWFENSSL